MTSHEVDVEYLLSSHSEIPTIIVDGVRAIVVDCEFHYHTSTDEPGTCLMMADVLLEDPTPRRLTVNLTTGISRIYF